MLKLNLLNSRRSKVFASLFILAVLVIITTVVVLAIDTIDLTTPGAEEEYNGAFFIQGPLPGSAGTGVLDPFLRISANSAVIKGYNTNFRPLQFQEDGHSFFHCS